MWEWGEGQHRALLPYRYSSATVGLIASTVLQVGVWDGQKDTPPPNMCMYLQRQSLLMASLLLSELAACDAVRRVHKFPQLLSMCFTCLSLRC